MKKFIMGIVAHVDAGKTTLSESLLYQSGAIRSFGRVDHGDTFLDTDELEKNRGITIFSKQARMTFGNMEITFVDTPGHVDFSAETERAFSVLDCAVLLVSAPDGVQSHTLTLWQLLEKYHIPTFIVVNKMDIARREKEEILAELQKRLHPDCIDFASADKDEEIATADEELLDEFLENGELSEESVAQAVADRSVFPVIYISALKQEGITDVLNLLGDYMKEPVYGKGFGARVYKIERDPKGQRFTYLKITGGTLKVKEEILPHGAYPDAARKINEIRLYSGDGYEQVMQAEAGSLVAVSGLDESYCGQGYGETEDALLPTLVPVLSYQVLLTEGQNPHQIWDYFKILEDEDPLLYVRWEERKKQLSVSLMGKIQLEVLKQKLSERFGEEVEFGPSNIVYRETIAGEVEGHGHFEPLRHFADVLLRMEPLPPNSGIEVRTECPTDVLLNRYQNQIMNRLSRRDSYGILTCSALTDIRFTIIDGKSHKKHTEGGDFRKATEIAVRNGLLKAENVLLEPYYHVTLTLPQASLGRAMTDIENMKGSVGTPVQEGEFFVLDGRVPVVTAMDYADQVRGYTGGLGRVQMSVAGYYPCHNAEDVIAETGYDYISDLKHPYESVYVHRENPDKIDLSPPDVPAAETVPVTGSPKPSKKRSPQQSLDDELDSIFKKTFGEQKRTLPSQEKKVISKEENIKKAREAYEKAHAKKHPPRPQKKKNYVLVDGYNVIFAWEELAALAKTNIDSARTKLLDILSNYAGFTGAELIAVFDAYKVKNNPGAVSTYHNIHVVYTKEAQTADAYIERTTHEIVRKENADVEVVSSDGLVQLIVIGHGARRISAREFAEELSRVSAEGMEMLH